jgi:hypothetical protein
MGSGAIAAGGNASNNGTVSQEPNVATKFYDKNGVALLYPKTWNIDSGEREDGASNTIQMGGSFAGGMKAKMTVATYDEATIVRGVNSNDQSNNIFGINSNAQIKAGGRYETDLKCGNGSSNCAGETILIPVQGHQTANGWHGKVVKISYGVFHSANYTGPNVGVSAQELYRVAQSAFQAAAGSVTVQGVPNTV